MVANNSSINAASTAVTHDVCFILFKDLNPHSMNIPNSIHPILTFVMTVNGLAAPPTMVVNALVIWAVMGNGTLRSSAFNLLLACLAVTDILAGLLVTPLYCLILGCLMNDCILIDCIFTAYLLSLTFCWSTSILSFTMASIERYLAIEKPNLYRNLTRKQVITTTVIIGLTGLGYLVLNTILLHKTHPNVLKIQVIILVSIMCSIILYCSSKVQLTAYRQRRAIAVQQASVQQLDNQQEQRQQEYKRVFTMSMLIVLSILFYTPFIVFSVIQAVMGKEVTIDIQYIAMPIVVTFMQLQSLVNPIIMSLRLSYIRKSIKNKLVCGA